MSSKVLAFFRCALSVGGILSVAFGTFGEIRAQENLPWPGNRTFVVGFAQDHMANDWRAAQVRDVRRELEKYPFIRFIATDAKGNTAKQIADIEDMAVKSVDVLITSPRDARAMAPVLFDTYRQGIPVILLSRRTENNDYTTFIRADNRAIANQIARHMAERLHGKGRILILQGIPAATTTVARTEGFIEQIANYEDIKIVSIKAANYLRGDAIRAIDEVLAEGLSFDAIYAQSDSMAIGARVALKHAGIDLGTVHIVGIDYIPEARTAIRTGEQDASFTYPTFGKEGAEIALRILRGESVPKEIIVESMKVTRENVEEVEPIF